MLTIERLVAGSGDVVALHKRLGKILRAFQHGTGLRGPDNRHMLRALVSLQVVVDALYQRVFRTNDHHVDILSYHELLDDLEVVSLHGDIDATICRTRIAWGNIQFLTFLTLSNLPSQCVLTSATA